MSGEWDMDKLSTNFTAPDIYSICRIPIGQDEDVWAWKHDKLGFFSVKSAYAQLSAKKRNNIGASTSAGSVQPFWNFFGKLRFHLRSEISGGEWFTNLYVSFDTQRSTCGENCKL